MLVSPRVYDVRTMPLDALLGFVLAALACHFVPALKRLLTPKARRLAAAKRGAEAAFAELGVSKTKQRNGVLVFVALFERTAVVVADEGVPTALLGEPYETRVSRARRKRRGSRFRGVSHDARRLRTAARGRASASPGRRERAQ